MRQSQVLFIGHMATDKGIEVDPAKVRAISECYGQKKPNSDETPEKESLKSDAVNAEPTRKRFAKTENEALDSIVDNAQGKAMKATQFAVSAFTRKFRQSLHFFKFLFRKKNTQTVLNFFLLFNVKPTKVFKSILTFKNKECI